MSHTGRAKIYLSKKNEVNIIKKAQKSLIFLVLFLLFLQAFPAKTNEVHAATLGEINSQIEQVSKNLEIKRGEAKTLQDQLDIIDGQIAQMQLQIEATQIEIDTTLVRIAETEKELQKQKKVLDEHLRVLYEESNTSHMEQIAGSNSFSDFVDKREYLTTMEGKIKTVVDKIKKIKDDLSAKRTKLEEMKKKQEIEKKNMDGQRVFKDSLLAKANADANGLQNKLNDLYAQKAALSVQFGESISHGSSGYPFGSPPPRSMIDAPDPWGYLIGECTSYVAWKRSVMGRPVPRAAGNAGQWAGMSNGGPSVGAVAVMPYIGGYGHVAMVEAVYGNGTILISEYNWIPYSFSTRVINPSNYNTVYIN